MVTNTISKNSAEVIWIGQQTDVSLPNLSQKNVNFYKKCIVGPLTLSIGDCVLVKNADVIDPDKFDSCDIGKILHLCEFEDMSLGDIDFQCAVVQWYSRPHQIPEKNFDSDDICIDFDLEVIEEHRPFDPYVSLWAIFAKCKVFEGSPENLATSLIQQYSKKIAPMFVCRYKFIREKNSKKKYRIVPLKYSDKEDDIESCVKLIPQRQSKVGGSAQKPSKREIIEEKRRRVSVCASSAVEYINLDSFPNENKVSPFKIVGGRSVVRLSASDRKRENPKATISLIKSPLIEQNKQTVTPKSRAIAARRNLNLSLDNESIDSPQSDCLNYSIVRQSDDDADSTNEMKIRLRISEREDDGFQTDPLEINDTFENIVAEYQGTSNDSKSNNACNGVIYHTPSKKHSFPKENDEARKSILKSAARRQGAEGTPRRSIQLSDIVEQRIFHKDEVVSTPKQRRIQNKFTPITANAEVTPSRRRARPTKAISPDRSDMRTPQKLRLIRSGEINPSINQRSASAACEDTGKSNLQIARDRLHVRSVPKCLPCREMEFENIYTFLESKIEDKCGGCMYISGVPGTGKTATVTHVIRTLQRAAEDGKLNEFEFIEINGMRLTEPRQAYVQIYKQITGKTVSWESAHTSLEKRFTTTSARRITTVLLVDELDILCNRRQDVVYNLLDWPAKAAARLVVVTIANTMDLPERLLMGKVTSRLGLTRLTFQPYTHKQLQEIVTARLSGTDVFKSDAVQLVARKVAAVSGDARRALDICRRATEIAERGEGNVKHKTVGMAHVQQALTEMIASAKVQAIRNCSRMETVFLQAVGAEVTRTGVEETSFMGVYAQIETIAAFEGLTVPTPGQALCICSKLCSERLLICEHSRNDVFQKILLNVSMDDVHYALKVNDNI